MTQGIRRSLALALFAFLLGILLVAYRSETMLTAFLQRLPGCF